ncbi:MAG: HypC/HybG/HupF family hydrogenase formation chaperone [Vulcanimicrobiaceae bacterium]
MCLAIPGQIVDFSAEQPLLARVDVGGVKRNVNVGLLADAPLEVGDWILIHVGFALSKIGEEQARDQLRMLQALGEDQLAIDEVRGYTFGEVPRDRAVSSPATLGPNGPASAGPGGNGGHAAPLFHEERSDAGPASGGPGANGGHAAPLFK